MKLRVLSGDATEVLGVICIKKCLEIGNDLVRVSFACHKSHAISKTLVFSKLIKISGMVVASMKMVQ